MPTFVFTVNTAAVPAMDTPQVQLPPGYLERLRFHFTPYGNFNVNCWLIVGSRPFLPTLRGVAGTTNLYPLANGSAGGVANTQWGNVPVQEIPVHEKIEPTTLLLTWGNAGAGPRFRCFIEAVYSFEQPQAKQYALRDIPKTPNVQPRGDEP